MFRCGPILRLWLLFLAISTAAYAQDGVYQLRIVAHAQLVPNDQRIGLATWAIFQNVMNQQSQRRLVLLGGVYKEENRWIEVMAGGVFSNNEAPSFLLDLRYSERRKRVNTFIETAYNFRTDNFLISPNVTTPVRLKRVRTRIGVEGDANFGRKRMTWAVGPRVVIPLLGCNRICDDVALVTAYRFQSDGRRVVRNYVAVTF